MRKMSDIQNIQNKEAERPVQKMSDIQNKEAERKEEKKGERKMTDDKYISAKRLKAHYAWWGDTEERKDLDAIVDAQPTADVQEVKHGSFIRCNDWHGYDYFKCTACGGTFYIADGSSFCDYDYCPRCGAKMDGKEKEE